MCAFRPLDVVRRAVIVILSKFFRISMFFNGANTTDVMRREVVARKRYTLESALHSAAIPLRLIGSRGTITTSRRET